MNFLSGNFVDGPKTAAGIVQVQKIVAALDEGGKARLYLEGSHSILSDVSLETMSAYIAEAVAKGTNLKRD
jgi:hypothetical protein